MSEETRCEDCPIKSSCEKGKGNIAFNEETKETKEKDQGISIKLS